MATMTTHAYTLRVLTPAFLGDADQNGRWRTPPIKHLLREWWRVAYAADHGFTVKVEDMRHEEGLLFGNAWLDNEYCKSQVRIRLDKWDEGRLKGWQGLEQGTVHHPEVSKTGFKVGPHAYLGYGPLDGRAGTKLNERIKTVVNGGDWATLSIAMPDEYALRLQRALWLMDRYGTLGGRSRNGWGSLTLTPINGTPKLDGPVPLREWKACLDRDWPHAIGQDENGPLIWQTAPHDDWKTLMKTLAVIKIGLRTQFVFTTGDNAPRVEERHWLSYPVTKHSVRAWNNLRLPNQLRFKVRPDNKDLKKLVGVIFHMPHLPPPSFSPDSPAIERTWQTVHALLDELCKPNGGRGYGMISDQTRRNQLKPELDKVALQRIKE